MTPRSLFAPARLAGQPILRTQSDQRLVDLVRAGVEPAFEAIVARYRRPLMRHCAGIVSEQRAEDVVQQTFVRAYEAMRQDDAELNLRPWLYRIAHNSALNALRDRGLRHEQLDDQIDGVERPDQALERSQGLQAVVAAVQGLPARQRDAIVLRELEGRSYSEIALELGLSGGAVRQLLNRARNNLRSAATAVTPTALILRVPWAGTDSVGVRVAELCGAGGAGAIAAKVCATALVTGAMVGGGIAVEEGARDDSRRAKASAGSGRLGAGGPLLGNSGLAGTALSLAGEDGSPSTGRRDERSGREKRSGHEDARSGRDHQSGHGGRDDGGDGDSGHHHDSGRDDRSGSREGSGLREVESESSGPGSGEERVSEDERSSSGPGSGEPVLEATELDTDSSGLSGSGSSGSGSSGSGSSGSGSGSSGSGSSGSGSGTSGSG
jgi:RNA polymerase sigma factor (sigma-70 family)